jgi:hypothetical protein
MLRSLQILLILVPQVVLCQIKTFDLIKDDSILSEKPLPVNIRFPVLIHQINMYDNFSFQFRHIPHISCFTWREFKGAWKQHGDTIIFTDSYSLEEADIKFEHSTNKQNKFYDFLFTLDSKDKYSNNPVQISFVYDYDAKIEDKKIIINTDSSGNIRIHFKEIQNLDQLTAFRIEVISKYSKNKWNYFTTNDAVNVRKEELPNIITVNILSNPYKKIAMRETMAILSKDGLYIISSKSEESKLPNDFNRLYFGSNYKRTYY